MSRQQSTKVGIFKTNAINLSSEDLMPSEFDCIVASLLRVVVTKGLRTHLANLLELLLEAPVAVLWR